MNTESLIQLGLSKNEAQIYETLIEHGELSVSEISKKALIHRRNVYDCMNRLLEKGLVVEILAGDENHYKAVAPDKLKEMLAEKTAVLNSIMPDLIKKYHQKPHNDEVYIYKGVEGWKNYMREIIKTGEDVYTIGGGGLWGDLRLKSFLDNFRAEAEKKNIKFSFLYDFEVSRHNRKIKGMPNSRYKTLPQKYSTPASVDIFGDYVVILTKGREGVIDDSIVTVIVNKHIADAFRIWFKLMWSVSS